MYIYASCATDTVHSLVAVLLLSLICTVKLIDTGLLRSSVGFRGPICSAALYVDWLKLTVEATYNIHSTT